MPQDPDDAFSKIPYEKGFAFLAFLERAAGGAEAFEPFFKAREKMREKSEMKGRKNRTAPPDVGRSVARAAARYASVFACFFGISAVAIPSAT